MTLRVLCILSAFLLARPVAPDSPPELEAPDTQKIQGTWEFTDIVIGGQSVLADARKADAKMVFAGVKVNLHDNRGPGLDLSFTLDPAKKPRAIDLMRDTGNGQSETKVGIYKLDGDRLQMCLSAGAKTRPTEFASPEKSDVMLLTLKRLKKSP